MQVDIPNAVKGSKLTETTSFPPIDLKVFENIRICRDDDFRSLVHQAATNADCEFLFEIPAEMIGENGKKAAALRYFVDDEPEYCFVVVSKNSGSINLLQESDVNEALSDFVHSYAAVLHLLASGEAENQNIH